MTVLLTAGTLSAAGCVQRVDRGAESATPTAEVRVEPSVTPVSTPVRPGAVAPEPSATAPPLPERSPVPAAGPAAATTPTPQPLDTPATSHVQRYGLFLEIEGLTEESVVRGDTVAARGRTSPDAVLSINGVVVPVDENGSFEVLLALDPGPNIIEVVASDLEGNEETIVLAVVSLPEGGS